MPFSVPTIAGYFNLFDIFLDIRELFTTSLHRLPALDIRAIPLWMLVFFYGYSSAIDNFRDSHGDAETQGIKGF